MKSKRPNGFRFSVGMLRLPGVARAIGLALFCIATSPLLLLLGLCWLFALASRRERCVEGGRLYSPPTRVQMCV